MLEEGSLSVGVNVDIERTDGRVHSAVVSHLNCNSNTVIVEWFEKGESKGKEIDFKTILVLNPIYASNETKGNVDNVVDVTKTIVPGTGPNCNQLYSRVIVPNKSDGISKIAQPVASTLRAPITSRPFAPTRVQTQITEDNDRSGTDMIDFSFDKGLKNANKKSNCVMEVEKIEKRRDERRAAQRALREQHDYDPRNPYYEFLMMIRDYQGTLDFNPLNDSEAIEYHQISVCLRKRPLNKIETGQNEIDVVIVPNKQTVIVHEPKSKVDLTKFLENHQFRFDYAFDEFVDNYTVYRFTAQPLVECIFERGMATCFAYGQTGSGKTHTMGGEFQSKGQQNASGGIYAFAATDLFQLLNDNYIEEDLIVHVAFFEIYGGKLYDLLNTKEILHTLEDHKGQVQIRGLKTVSVNSVDDVLFLLQVGNLCRTSGQTAVNAYSSRSHAVFQMILKKRLTDQLWGKFSLIDLAGNERGADTCSSDRRTRMEGAEINKSLLALKECIRALGRKGAHRPFRASKLTQVLRDSFIGARSRTCMIATISPGMHSCEHTLNTLRYADRVKELDPDHTKNVLLPSAIVNQRILPAGDCVENSSKIKAQNTANNNRCNQNPYENLAEDDDHFPCKRFDDLALVRAANTDLIDDEMFHFQELVNQIEEYEDIVCLKHKYIVENFPTLLKRHASLIDMTKDVDYHIEEYATQLEELLEEEIYELTDLKESVQLLRSSLGREEEISNSFLTNKKSH